MDALIGFVLDSGVYKSYRFVANIAERRVGAFGADRNTGQEKWLIQAVRRCPEAGTTRMYAPSRLLTRSRLW